MADILDKIEPEVCGYARPELTGEAGIRHDAVAAVAALSAAISLKRIADSLDKLLASLPPPATPPGKAK